MEKAVEAYLRQRVKAAGGIALKLVCPGLDWVAGSPDSFTWGAGLLRGNEGPR